MASSLVSLRPTLLAPDRSDSEALPTWARAVFPEGLGRISDGIWAPREEMWDVARQSRRNVDGLRRVGDEQEAPHFERLLRQAMPAVDVHSEALVLDIRSGDGARSVLPWLTVLPHARVVASDTASTLLATLVHRAKRSGHGDRLLAVLSEPDAVPVAPGSIDLVSGVNCLHELQDPDLVLAAAANALRPGGRAIFLLPFDGHGVLRIAYERICAEAALWPNAPLPPAVRTALQLLSADIDARTLPDPVDPGFAQLAQKWLFGRESLEIAARLVGFREVRFLSHHDHETLYRDFALVQLRLVTGADKAELPAWALAVLDSFDRALRPPVKRLLMLEGTMVLTR